MKPTWEHKRDEVEVTGVIDMRPITNMKLYKTLINDDVREVASELEKQPGVRLLFVPSIGRIKISASCKLISTRSSILKFPIELLVRTMQGT